VKKRSRERCAPSARPKKNASSAPSSRPPYSPPPPPRARTRSFIRRNNRKKIPVGRRHSRVISIFGLGEKPFSSRISQGRQNMQRRKFFPLFRASFSSILALSRSLLANPRAGWGKKPHLFSSRTSSSPAARASAFERALSRCHRRLSGEPCSPTPFFVVIRTWEGKKGGRFLLGRGALRRRFFFFFLLSMDVRELPNKRGRRGEEGRRRPPRGRPPDRRSSRGSRLV